MRKWKSEELMSFSWDRVVLVSRMAVKTHRTFPKRPPCANGKLEGRDEMIVSLYRFNSQQENEKWILFQRLDGRIIQAYTFFFVWENGLTHNMNLIPINIELCYTKSKCLNLLLLYGYLTELSYPGMKNDSICKIYVIFVLPFM